MEFRSWKVAFRTGVCLRTADPQINMLWIKEVEIAKLIDELVTSRSIMERTDCPDFDMQDAMIASAVKRHLDTHLHLRWRVCVEGAACSKIRPILTRKTNCLHDLRAFPCNWSLWSGTRTRKLVLCKFTERRCPRVRRYVGSSSIITKRNAFRCDPRKIVQVKTAGLWSPSDRLGFVRPRKTVRHNRQTSYSRLKMSVKLHVGQMMRTRNFRVWSEVMERRAVTKSQEGKKAVERKVEECFQWKAQGQCSKEDSCNFSNDPLLASG